MPSDVRVVEARKHHAAVKTALADAERHRKQRNRLVTAVYRDPSALWTHASLAAAVGCSKDLVASIVTGRAGRPR